MELNGDPSVVTCNLQPKVGQMPDKRGYVDAANKASLPKNAALTSSASAIADGISWQISQTTETSCDHKFDELLEKLTAVKSTSDKRSSSEE